MGILGDTDDNKASGILKNTVIAVLLRYLSNFVDCLKCHWLIAKLNWNTNGRSIVF